MHAGVVQCQPWKGLTALGERRSVKTASQETNVLPAAVGRA